MVRATQLPILIVDGDVDRRCERLRKQGVYAQRVSCIYDEAIRDAVRARWERLPEKVRNGRALLQVSVLVDVTPNQVDDPDMADALDVLRRGAWGLPEDDMTAMEGGGRLSPQLCANAPIWRRYPLLHRAMTSDREHVIEYVNAVYAARQRAGRRTTQVQPEALAA